MFCVIGRGVKTKAFFDLAKSFFIVGIWQNFLFSVLLCLFCVACFQKKPTHYLPPAETLFVSISTEPPTLDWNKSTDTTSSLIINNIMEGLVEYDFSKKEPAVLPALAQKWFSSKDQKHWTFTLKKNVYWSDGLPLTARHFVDGWQRLLHPKTASGYAYFLYDIKNAEAYNKGEIKDFSRVGVSVDTKGRLQIELKEGKSYFPFLLSNTSTYPLRRDIVNSHKNWTDPKNIVTLGAYRLKEWQHDKHILLERNPEYHAARPKIKNVLIRIITESTTELNLFHKGRLDFVSVPSSQIPALKHKKEYREHPILGIYFYGMNVKKYPFNDVRVRRAFAHAINRRQIVHLLQAGHIPLSGWIPKSLFGYDASLGLKFNPVEARRLLRQAGYSDKNPFPKVVLSYNTNEDHKKVAESVQAQLKKYLQIEVELSSQEWKTYLQFLKTGESALFRMGWLVDYPDPHNFMNLMSSVSSSNNTFWKSHRYDHFIRAASLLPNGGKRFMLYKKAQQILTEEEVPVIPIYSMQSHRLIHRRVVHFPFNVMDRIQFKKVVLH